MDKLSFMSSEEFDAMKTDRGNTKHDKSYYKGFIPTSVSNIRYGSYSRADRIKDTEGFFGRLASSAGQLATNIGHDFMMAGVAQNNFLTQGQMDGFTDIDVQTMYQMKERNNNQYVNEALGGKVWGQISLGLFNTGKHMVTQGASTYFDNFGSKYAEGLEKGYGKGNALLYGVGSGAVTAIVENSMNKIMPSYLGLKPSLGTHMLSEGISEMFEEPLEAMGQLGMDMIFDKGNLPQEFQTPEGENDWAAYWKKTTPEVLKSMAYAFVMGGAFGAVGGSLNIRSGKMGQDVARFDDNLANKAFQKDMGEKLSKEIEETEKLLGRELTPQEYEAIVTDLGGEITKKIPKDF